MFFALFCQIMAKWSNTVETFSVDMKKWIWDYNNEESEENFVCAIEFYYKDDQVDDLPEYN